jgi:hypothetical protein
VVAAIARSNAVVPGTRETLMLFAAAVTAAQLITSNFVQRLNERLCRMSAQLEVRLQAVP